MDFFIIILLILLLVGLAAAIFILLGQKRGSQGEEYLAVMAEKIDQLKEQSRERMETLVRENRELRQALDTKLSEAHRTTQEQYRNTQEQIGQTMKTVHAISGQSAKLIGEVTDRLTSLDETNKQVLGFSAQLQGLQDILKNPKQRGILGEIFLEETLANVLPPGNFQMQYKFSNGDIVDAVVFVKDKVVPIDSKFSLENYEKILNCKDAAEHEKLEKLFKQDLKNRIDETAKYVRPAEGTMDFAFMFIPSESIYYDLLINKVGAIQISTTDLIEYAFKQKKVIIVSPTNFLAYLQTVLQGLRALQIEESAKHIREQVEKLGRHLVVYDDFMRKLGVSMGATVGHYNNAYKEFAKIDKDVIKIGGGERQIEAVTLERPLLE